MQRDSNSPAHTNTDSNSNANAQNDDDKTGDDDDSDKEFVRQDEDKNNESEEGASGHNDAENEEEADDNNNDDDKNSDSQSSSDSYSIPSELGTQQEVEDLIRKVNRDPKLTTSKKSRIVQNIHSQRYAKRRKLNTAALVTQFNKRARGKTYSDITDEKGQLMLGCEHYARKCRIRAECCGAWVVCRHCHDHDPAMNHSIDRFATKLVRCMLCEHDEGQPVAKNCKYCGVEFARYFCAKCKFYDDMPGKKIYHCDKCKICRIGKGLGIDNFHCDKCDACVSRKYLTDHKCLKKSLDANCPICGLYIKTSIKPVVFMQCGHTMHAHCFDEYTTEYYYCPLCHKSLTDMTEYFEEIRRALEQETLPEEIRNRGATVFCHECDKRCETNYHYMHLMCQRCKGFNTTLIKWYEKSNPTVTFTQNDDACTGQQQQREGNEQARVSSGDDDGTGQKAKEDDNSVEVVDQIQQQQQQLQQGDKTEATTTTTRKRSLEDARDGDEQVEVRDVGRGASGSDEVKVGLGKSDGVGGASCEVEEDEIKRVVVVGDKKGKGATTKAAVFSSSSSSSSSSTMSMRQFLTKRLEFGQESMQRLVKSSVTRREDVPRPGPALDDNEEGAVREDKVRQQLSEVGQETMQRLLKSSVTTREHVPPPRPAVDGNDERAASDEEAGDAKE